MPNWCSHTITFSGPRAAIDNLDLVLRAACGDEVGQMSVLSTFLPRPTALDDTVAPPRPPHSDHAIAAAEPGARDAMLAENAAYEVRNDELRSQYGHSDWYSWSHANWGVKWPDRTHAYQRRARSVQIVGECPWGPPLDGLLAISAILPDLRCTIEYFECGMGFAGKFVATNGVEVYHHTRTYRGSRGG